MSATTLHPLASAYLKRLRAAGRRLPTSTLRELVAEIEAHLWEATDATMSDASVIAILDRLGDPEEIISAQQPEPPTADSHSTRDWATIFLLLFGGFVVGIGWIAGVILLWSSRAWSTRDKLIGTLVWPGGLAAGVYGGLIASAVTTGQQCGSVIGVHTGKRIVLGSHCSGGASTISTILALALLAVLLLAPIGTSISLARSAAAARDRSRR